MDTNLDAKGRKSKEINPYNSPDQSDRHILMFNVIYLNMGRININLFNKTISKEED